MKNVGNKYEVYPLFQRSNTITLEIILHSYILYYRLHLVHATHMNLSSSMIRACARNIVATREQLHSCIQIDSVTKYIIQHHLWNTQLDSCPTTVPVLSTFPNEITDLTPELLSYMLCAYSNLSVKVNSFMFEQIGVGLGWNGSVYRLYDIQYSSDSIDCLPSSMVLKLSNGTWLQRIASVEPEFYLKLAPHISTIEIPKLYYTSCHSYNSIKSLLLLEDLSINYQPLDSKKSLTDSTIFFLIVSIACLHAEFFKHPMLQQEMFSWLPSLNSTLTHYHTEYTRKMTDKQYTELLESKVSSKAYAYAKQLMTHIQHIFQMLTDENYTLSHGDFWINNIFVRRDQSHRIILFDWQTCCRANGLIDVVFLLRLLGNNRARLIELQALHLYHQTLVKYGITHYDLSVILDDYYTLALPFMFVIISSLKVLTDNKFKNIIMMLEDIVAYDKKSK